MDLSRFNSASDLNDFYSSEPIWLWKKLIGEQLLYSFGDFSQTTDPQEALCNNTRAFYPYIPHHATVLDLGCGWGGPAQLLQTERNCQVTGVTISESQYHYCKNELGLTTIHGDIEKLTFSEQYDIVWMMESLEHIVDIAALFQHLSTITNKLLIQTNCIADHMDTPRWEFGNTMYMRKVSELKQVLSLSGWKIEQVEDRRFHSIPTFQFWRNQLEVLKAAKHPIKGQLRVLEQHVVAFESNPIQWCRNHPLINLIAVQS
ncbi:MAG: SAM-dependent methyltransferase [Flammeovirgaceae bacterium]